MDKFRTVCKAPNCNVEINSKNHPTRPNRYGYCGHCQEKCTPKQKKKCKDCSRPISLRNLKEYCKHCSASSVLKASDIPVIRHLIAIGISQIQIAKEYQVSRQNINRIHKQVIWKGY